MLNQLKILKTKCWRWLIPPICVFCNDIAEGNYDVCGACLEELPWLKQVCQCCGLALPENIAADQLCGQCLHQVRPFNKTFGLFSYQSPVDRLITGLKFHQKLVYAELLGQLLGDYLLKQYDGKALPECIIPVPLHQKRLRERGFNQALEIARPIARKLKLPIDLQSCERIRSTVSQTTLPAQKRYANVRNAFLVKSTFNAKHVAILDDVITTGHTITELANLLRKSGVEKIDVWCCARTNMAGN